MKERMMFPLSFYLGGSIGAQLLTSFRGWEYSDVYPLAGGAVGLLTSSIVRGSKFDYLLFAASAGMVAFRSKPLGDWFSSPEQAGIAFGVVAGSLALTSVVDWVQARRG